MRLDSLVFAIAGVCFGLIAGWVIGAQYAQRSPARAPVTESSASAPASQAAAPAIIDENRAQTLRAIAERDQKNIESRVQLGNLYYDGERYDQAIPWYEQALKLDSTNADVSTDLGVSYYQTNQPDRALQQFEHSLKVNPKHVKTLLNIGVVRAFAKQDLEGATNAWKQVVELAPGSQEARVAQRALETISEAHQGIDGSASGGTGK
ncbi:MAG TPA: tetratricopeptide repeat protein [Vicinamibacterales bacterium]